MPPPEFVIDKARRTPNGTLFSRDLQQIKVHLLGRGMVMLPSDTCYSLAALAISKEMYKSINKILNRDDIPISLAFPNFRTLEEYVSLDMKSAQLLEAFTPGPITVVCKASSRLPALFSEDVVRSDDGTVGVRIPDSIVEREVAGCTQYAITTVAIRDKKNAIVQDFESAVRIVSEGFDRLTKPTNWGAVEGSNFFSRNSSVVRVSEGTRKVQMIREGEIPFEAIQKVADMIPQWAVEDFT